nr:sensor histidine kinase [Pseudonocardia spinosispora]
MVQLVGLGVLVAVGGVLAYLNAADTVNDRARNRALAVARTIADTPSVLTDVTGPNPTALLQPFAERVRGDAGVDFVTIMNLDGIRFTHPNPELIGEEFIGNTAAARAGGVVTETYTGSLGPSIRAVVPVFDAGHRVTAMVAVGITVNTISADLAGRLVSLIVAAAAMLLVGGVGSFLISRRLSRQTQGLAPAELSRVFASYEATLHAVREGLVLVDADSRVVLCNDGARDLLGLTESPVGALVSDLGLAAPLAEALAAGEARLDEIHVTDTRVVVLNSATVRSDGVDGNVVTLRDHTDLQLLSGELDTTRGLAESLHAQAHESANRLHTVVSLVEMGRTQEAVEFATAELTLAQQLTDRVVGAVAEPVLAALLLGKAAEASERGVELVFTDDTALDDTRGIEPRALVTILGNLIDNAMDAAIEGLADGRPKVIVTVRVDGTELLLRVADTGRGVPEEARAEVFRRGFSTKPHDGPAGRGLGLALVGQAVRSNRGTIELDRDHGAVFTVRLPISDEASR